MTSNKTPSPSADSAPDAPGFLLHLPPESTSISIARAVLRRTVRFGDDDVESRFLTAFTDLLINAIEEHQRSGISRAVTVSGSYGEGPAVAISDSGTGYTEAGDDSHDGMSSPTVHTDGMPSPRGRGVAIATLLVPDIHFESSSRGTTVTMPLAGYGVPR